MGLRVNTNTPALTSLRLLQGSEKSLSTSLQRLSTGLRVNRAADDPSALVISEQLRAQVDGLQAATRNAQGATHMVNTAEAALGEVHALLVQIRQSAVLALNSGAASSEQLDAEQDAVDRALQAIDRVASTTRFASRPLLSGASAIEVTTKDAGISELMPVSVSFDRRSSETAFSLVVSESASQALVSAVGGSGVVASGGDLVLRVTGELGTQEVAVPEGTTTDAFEDAINALRSRTGVYASAGMLLSDGFGSDAMLRLQQIGGAGTFTGAGGAIATQGEIAEARGEDAVATLQGVSVNARGNVLNVVSGVFTGRLELEPYQQPGTHDFTLRESGLLFQLSEVATAGEQAVLGIPSMYSRHLGRAPQQSAGATHYGTLHSVGSGGASDLHTDPVNALRIIDAALQQVSSVRGHLGAFVSAHVEPAVREMAVHLENLQASESTIRDLDFARETAQVARDQVLLQSGLAVLAQASALPLSVLQLLE